MNNTIYDILKSGIDSSPITDVPTSVPYNVGRVSTDNSTATPLAAGATFTGTGQDVVIFPALCVAVLTDQDGTLYVEFSTDNTNWDSSIALSIGASVNEVHKFTVTRQYMRVRFTNTSASPQTYIRLQTILDTQTALTSALNSTVQQDADSQVVRAVDSEIDIASGKYVGFSITNKFGVNPSIDTASVPEDVWDGGGTYTGWATSAETVQVFSASGNDTSAGTGARTVVVIGLDANYNVISETVTLNGVTPVTTSNSYIRMHTARVASAGSGGVNAGILTFRQSTTTANVFLNMVVGSNQTFSTNYTVPAGYTAYLRRLTASVGKVAAVLVEGSVWTRTFGEVFRARRPFFISDTVPLVDTIFGGLIFTQKTDIIVRITSCSKNSTGVNAGYDLLLVKN